MIMMYKMEIFFFAVDLNNLPQEVMESDDVWTLKSKLDIYWKHYRFSYSQLAIWLIVYDLVLLDDCLPI